MKKFKTLAIVIFLLILSLNISSKDICENPINILNTFFSNKLNLNNFKIKKYMYDKNINLCIALIDDTHKNFKLLYSLNGKYLFLGKILNIETKTDYLEENYADDFNKFNKLFSYKNIIKLNKNNKKLDLILFVDPLCPYCKKALNDLIKYKNKINVGIILSPLNINHLDISINIICSNNPIQSFLNTDNLKNKSCKKAYDMIKFSTKIKNELNLHSEPIYFFKNGKYLTGYQNIKTIFKYTNK